ncbi:MAG TPA: MlaD family protein, partial [Conexibacter sp.]|nr:MlaD family protein [Conexibacter sp.]
MNRRNTSVAANPVLIGAATVLVVIVAVFLAYNANNGLPFVPTYQLWMQVPDASALVTGNEVRIGGDRVGIIDKIEPKTHSDGGVTARLHVKLQTDVKPLPRDSTVIVR